MCCPTCGRSTSSSTASSVRALPTKHDSIRRPRGWVNGCAAATHRHPGSSSYGSLDDTVNIWTTPEREQLRKTVRSFAEREILPNVDEWERSGDLPRELHRRAGAAGLLGAGFPESVGGGGGDGADAVLICEEMHQAGAPGGVFASLFTCGIAVPHMIASRRCKADRHVRPADADRRQDRRAGHHRARRRIGRRAPAHHRRAGR